MKVNYFDFGLCSGEELYWMVNNYFPALEITDYSAYGFEAARHYYENNSRLHATNEHVSIVHCAVCENHNDMINLYHAPNTVGHSIYPTKSGVDSRSYESVSGIVFSKWLDENNIVLDGCLNIIKMNIEGAEWCLLNDLVKTGLIDRFSIFLGTGHDIDKVDELKDNIQEYYDLLACNNIVIHRYTEHKPENNADIASLIINEIDRKHKG